MDGILEAIIRLGFKLTRWKNVMRKPLHKAYFQHPLISAVILRDVAEITDVQTEIKYNEQALK